MEQLYDPAPDEAVYQSVRITLESARTKAAAAVNDAMVSAYWEIGRQITEAQGDRAEYGKHLMEYLSKRLTAEFGKGFTERNLRAMRQLHLAYPMGLYQKSLTGKSRNSTMDSDSFDVRAGRSLKFYAGNRAALVRFIPLSAR